MVRAASEPIVSGMPMRRAIREKNQLLSRVLALLKRIEWNPQDFETMGETHFCPDCENFRNEGHRVDCELAALIRELSE